jgi:rRNA maturation RNase YbeY
MTRGHDPKGRALSLLNQQRTRSVNVRSFRRVLTELLNQLVPDTEFDLGFRLVGKAEIIRLNEQFLHHAGSTDVISFDYSERGNRKFLSGEIFICVDEAVAQASRYRTTWQRELVRYAVHGVLHLCGYDDSAPSARRLMKRREERLLSQLARQFNLNELARRHRGGLVNRKS